MEKWVKRWGFVMSAKPVLPGVWRRKDGGHVVRARVKNERSGRQVEILRSLPAVTNAKQAFEILAVERRAAREAIPNATTRTIPTFKSYAVSLFARKIRDGEIKSAATKELWDDVLENHLLPSFGEMPIDGLRRGDIEEWKDEIAAKTKPNKDPDVTPEHYSPVTMNQWLRMLGTIMTEAVTEYELDRNPMLGVKPFDTSEVRTYTPEEPGSLTPDEVRPFLAKMRTFYPQHYAMAALGFAIGARPSSLRPLRRKGATPDIDLDRGVLYVRRSHTRGKTEMNATKTKRDQFIYLPVRVVEILRWHIDTQLTTDEQKQSDLLFPTEAGGYRSTSALWKPFAAVAKKCKLEKTITPRGMRRTFQDLARAANVHDLVTRSISGHQSETMQFHYSTVNAKEQRAAIGKVISLFPSGGAKQRATKKKGAR